MLVLDLRVRAKVSIKVRLLGHEMPGYEKVRVRNVLQPSARQWPLTEPYGQQPKAYIF